MNKRPASRIHRPYDELNHHMDRAGVKLVLHGDEDIEADLGPGFLLDFLAIKNAFLSLHGISYLDEASGSDLSVKTVY